MESSNTIPANYEGHVYAVVAPIFDGGDGTGWAFLGETDKYVTASSIRFTNMQGRMRACFNRYNYDKLTYLRSLYEVK